MKETFYKPLTPSLRADINSSIDKNISELRTCESNGLVNMQIIAQNVLKNMINNLPDGFLMPMERTDRI